MAPLHTPGWHGEFHTPIVDDKYTNPITGEIQSFAEYTKEHGNPGMYSGPPAVDIIIQSIHAETTSCCYRAARPVPMEALMLAVMSEVKERKLSLDSITATPYAIRVVLCHPLTKDEFYEIGGRMINSVLDEKE